MVEAIGIFFTFVVAAIIFFAVKYEGEHTEEYHESHNMRRH